MIVSEKRYDFTSKVAIVGAGPAGCAASFELSKLGQKHLIIDKAIFPRDKICGDGLSPRVFFVLRQLFPELLPKLAAQTHRFKAIETGMGVAPNGSFIDLPLINPTEDGLPGAFTSKRIDFDHFLVENLNADFAHQIFGASITAIDRIATGFELTITKDGKEHIAFAESLIGADGDRSFIKKKLAPAAFESEHYLVGVRAYYQNVGGMKNTLEFYLFDRVLPGYFWIFPLADGTANVGVGMLSTYVRDNKVNLRELLIECIEKEPALIERFKDVELQGKIVGWGLPVASNPSNVISGERFMLIGDAGAFIDPFSGEGIASAFYTGMYAAQAIVKAKNDFSAANFKKLYDHKIKRTMRAEFKVMHIIQKIYFRPRLINFVLGSFGKNKFLIENAGLIFDPKTRSKLYNPIFFLRLLWGFVNINRKSL
ncbi:MAG: geranylgeranyl reductase family protein [Saprospiraceae bacterium]